MMRPTAASASKTHDKPASPPHKSTKAPVGVLQKGKKKVEEVAAKAKDAITTNGHGTEENKTNGSSANDEAAETHHSELAEAETAAPQETTDAATSVQDAEASTAEVQTPQQPAEVVR
jgi:hypothetical protein